MSLSGRDALWSGVRIAVLSNAGTLPPRRHNRPAPHSTHQREQGSADSPLAAPTGPPFSTAGLPVWPAATMPGSIALGTPVTSKGSSGSWTGVSSRPPPAPAPQGTQNTTLHPQILRWQGRLRHVGAPNAVWMGAWRRGAALHPACRTRRHCTFQRSLRARQPRDTPPRIPQASNWTRHSLITAAVVLSKAQGTSRVPPAGACLCPL